MVTAPPGREGFVDGQLAGQLTGTSQAGGVAEAGEADGAAGQGRLSWAASISPM